MYLNIIKFFVIDLTSCNFMFFLDGSRTDSRGEGFGGVRGERDKRVVKKLVSWKSTLLIAIQAPGETWYNYMYMYTQNRVQ